MLVGIYTVLFFISFISTNLIRNYATTHLMDLPGSRSSHTVPTPRGGGMAIAVSFYLGLSVLLALGLIGSHYGWIVLGAVPLIWISWLDDHQHVPIRYRLAVQLSSAVWLVYLAWPDMLGSLIPANPVMGVVGTLLCTVLIIWIINLYNFMDGIDALAGLEFCSLMLGVVCSLIWLDRLQGSGMETAFMAVLGLVSVLGFLPLNWPPARIFMGDTGSNFLGYLLAAMAMITISQHHLGVAFWLIAPAVFWMDASVTLAKRLLTGQAIYQPHRTHAYQHAALRFNSHKKVSVTISAINLLYLIPLALFSELYTTFVGIFIAAAYLPVFSLAIYFKAGTLLEQER